MVREKQSNFFIRPPYRLFTNLQRGFFRNRLNRFTVECTTGGKITKAYLPNPGRLWELLLPKRTLYLTKAAPSPNRNTKYTIVGVEKEGLPVMLHTQLANTVARWMIEQDLIPMLEGASTLRPEITIGNSRFDFLVQNDRQKMVVEVKSCTLFGKELAMFPDAVTVRGRRHLRELSSLPEGLCGGVIFLAHWSSARFFMPDYHTDLNFSRTLFDLRNNLMIKAFALEWRRDLTPVSVYELEVPWGLIERESHDRGSYILILHLKKNSKLLVGSLGKVTLGKGYYLYVGSAKANLTKRIQRHERRRKRLFWHIDYLREKADFCNVLPVRASVTLECEMAEALKHIADWLVPGFGSSDCSCTSHLFGMHTYPITSPSFIRTLQHFRIDRLQDILLSAEPEK